MSDNEMTLSFRCPAELEGRLPPPIPATLGLPAWPKAMPTQAFNAISSRNEDTLKRCPPFVDAMTCGFLIPLICDLRIANGEITWDNDIPRSDGKRSGHALNVQARQVELQIELCGERARAAAMTVTASPTRPSLPSCPASS